MRVPGDPSTGRAPMIAPYQQGAPTGPGMPPMREPTYFESLSANPLFQMGLGILGAQGNYGDWLGAAAQGAQQGLSVAQQAQARMDRALEVAWEKTQQREDENRKRDIQQQQDYIAEQYGQTDPTVAMLLRANPGAAASILAEREKTGAARDVAQRSLDVYRGAQGPAPGQPLAPFEPTYAAGQGGQGAPAEGGPVGEGAPAPQAPQGPSGGPGDEQISLGYQLLAAGNTEAGEKYIMEGQKLNASAQQQLAEEQRKIQSPGEMRAAAADVEKYLSGPKAVLTNAEQVRSLLEEDPSNPLAALVAIQTFQKMADEGAVVRESDIAMIQGAQGLMGTVKSYIDQYQSGKPLTPEQQQNMLKAVDTMAAVAQKVAEGNMEALRARYGTHYRPEQIGMQWSPTWTPTAQRAAQRPPQGASSAPPGFTPEQARRAREILGDNTMGIAP